ncbi:hypothetical protein [Hyphomonas johnsonii]|uniref:Uncharacterized protein n=1 Tax=Hyphomonas johnsonii MHS-2 TaxID=1280950 RepID=A0A059FQJ6_9PROT|nr:hypothetical protein [Hyphomonas johnsonii]KCZ92940.1 hypothetical protein HJO_08292 [Hyphomonas johnsonii MHS-2]
MTFHPTTALRSLVAISWLRADCAAFELKRWLGLGLTGCKPFLPRGDAVRLRTELVRLEALVRRLLVLMVLELPLPVLRPHAPATAAASPPTGPGPRNPLAAPAFRLSEPPARAAATLPPAAPRRMMTRPRLRYLDQPLPPPEPGECPPRPADLVPVRPLVQRLRALCAAFQDPAPLIARMARRLARTGASTPVLRTRLAPVVTSRRQPASHRDAIREIHHTTLAELSRIDTS